MPTTARHRSLYIGLLAIFVAVPLVNYMPFLLDVERGDARFEDDVDTYIDAAGYAFSIWGVIFLGMLAFAWGRLRQNAEAPTEALHRAIAALMVAGLASMAFVPLSYTNNQLWIWLDVLVHLLALVMALHELRKHVAQQPIGDDWRWTMGAVSMYAGWISAATVISTALFLNQYVGLELEPQLAAGIAMVMIAILFLIGQRLLKARMGIYGLTVAWALIAIGVEQTSPIGLRWLAWGAATGLIAIFAARYFGKQPLFYWSNAK